MPDQYLNSKVTVTVDVTDASAFVADEAPSLAEIDDGVKRDLTSMIKGYFTSFGNYEVHVNVLDVAASHVLVETAEAKA